MAIIIDLTKKPLRHIPILKDVKEIERLKEHVVKNGGLFIPPYRYEMPKLPEWTNKNYYYKQYKVNPYNFSCSCEWWNNKRKIYPDGDLRLVCKHIYYKITGSPKLLNSIDDLTLQLIKSYLFHGESLLLKAVLGKAKLTFYVGAKYKSDWYNIYVKAGDKWERYGYSMIERRWSYHKAPEAEISMILYFLNTFNKVIKQYLNEKD